jgi:hypothetical protein
MFVTAELITVTILETVVREANNLWNFFNHSSIGCFCCCSQDEVIRLKAGTHRENVALNKDAINRQTKESEQQLRELYENEVRLRQRMTMRLDQATDKAAKAQAL